MDNQLRRKPSEPAHRRGVDGVSNYVISLAWGVLWRYGLLVAAIVVKESGYHPPLLQVAVFAGVALTGAVVGVWRSGSRFAAVWRMVTLSVLVVFVAPGLPAVYPYVVVAAVAVATLEPFRAAMRRRRRGDRSWPAPPAPQAPQPPQPYAPIYSDDGRFLWNGAVWVPLPAPVSPPQLAAEHASAALPPRRRRRSR